MTSIRALAEKVLKERAEAGCFTFDALVLQPGLCVVLLQRRHGHVEPERSRGLG